MDGTYNALRRHAENDLTSIRQRLDSGARISVDEAEQLARIQKDLSNAIKNYNEMQGKRPYSDTNIGYSADTRQRGDARSDARSDANEAMRSAMDAVNKILPHISDDYADYADDMDDMDDMEMRRGVPGTGRGRYRGRKRTRVRGYTRRADMDDMDDERYMDDHYDRMHDAVARAAADAAAATARYMTNDMRSAREIYPGTPVMPGNDNYNAYNAYNAAYNAHDAARGNAYNDARNDARSDARSDNARSDAHRPGPGMRE